jgi:osmotically-inducible protein OsmY
MNGDVALNGTVPNYPQYLEAEAADVTGLVEDALDRYALLADDSDIGVEASDGTIVLTGHVRNWAEHDAVIDAAWTGFGVKDVRDELLVSR